MLKPAPCDYVPTEKHSSSAYGTHESSGHREVLASVGMLNIASCDRLADLRKDVPLGEVRQLCCSVGVT